MEADITAAVSRADMAQAEARELGAQLDRARQQVCDLSVKAQN